MTDHLITLIGVLFSCIFTICSVIYSYFNLFFKMKFEIAFLKASFENLEKSIHEEKKTVNIRFDKLDDKIESNTQLIINAITNHWKPNSNQ